MNTNWIRRAEPRHEGEQEGRPVWDVRDVRERRLRFERAVATQDVAARTPAHENDASRNARSGADRSERPNA